MVITEFLERNARLYGSDTALVELNPSQERDSAVTWREASLIESAGNGAPYRRELSWTDFDRRANRFANLLLSRGLKRETKVGILMMNCLEWLPYLFWHFEGGRGSGAFEFPVFIGRNQILSGTCRCGSAGFRAGVYQPDGCHSG